MRVHVAKCMCVCVSGLLGGCLREKDRDIVRERESERGRKRKKEIDKENEDYRISWLPKISNKPG